MIEHRLIERMITLMSKEAQRIEQGIAPNTEFISTAVDFIKIYAERLHHGKEEDILFRDLAKKQLSADHKRIMGELIKEHALGRESTRKLVEARDRYLAGEKESIVAMAENLNMLVKFYPKHIEKEDKHFFLPVMTYLNKYEQSAMLAEFNPEFAIGRGIRRTMPHFFFLKKFVRCPCIALAFFVEKVSASLVSVLTSIAKSGFNDFDRQFIHATYKNVVTEWDKK